MAVNKILVTVCVIQFGIISLWISTPPKDFSHPYQTAPVSPVQPGQPSGETALLASSKPHLSASPVIPSCPPVPAQSYARMPPVGVAAVVMLHSPKWFQRRYTMMLQNIYNNMPHGWAVQVFFINEGGSKTGIEINPGIERLREAGKIVMTEIPQHIWYKKKRRSDFFLVPWLWESMLAEKVLLFGGNTVLCSNSPLTVDNFTQFDYIGTPWGSFKGRGGSGELSLRSRSVMLDAIRAQLAKQNISEGFTDKWGLEDNFFVRSIIEFISNGRPLKLAERKDSQMFAASNAHSSSTVFAASGTLAGVTDEERLKFFDYCPEIKVIFPSLHNPGCFGADLKKDQCANSICALRPEKKSC